ncbi:MAG: FISUMP domain-containing protein, partial [Flavobacteriales bacterium]|nr:FISUMP domain-containing protein [Flavobacteriales bacterium]
MRVIISIFSTLITVCVLGQSPCNNLTSISHHGYEYEIVEIGDQCWFSENCRYLPEVSPASEVIDFDDYYGTNYDELIEPHYYVNQYYGTDLQEAMSTENYETYGVLYNKPAVMTEDICPSGWHIPTHLDWTQLDDFLGENVAGYEMKSISGWANNGNGSNSSGFNGLPGGELGQLSSTYLYPDEPLCENTFCITQF